MKLRKRIIRYFTKIMLMVCFFLCYTLSSFAQSHYPEIIEVYKKEEEKLIAHYTALGDAEKLKAAQFLIDNIPIQKSETCVWRDRQGNRMNYRELDYDDFGEASEKLIALQEEGLLSSIEVTWDMEHITAEFLIDNIERSFELWKTNPWSRSYNFQDFCEYILPYRNLTEPMESDWKKEYYTLYKGFRAQVADMSDPVQVNTAIVDEMKHFKFTFNRTYPQPHLSAAQLLFRREGSCPDLTSAAIFAGRAFGLAITYDFTPFFAASSSAHSWNTVIDTEGMHIPYNGASSGAFAGSNNKRMGKVLRYTFSRQKQALVYTIPWHDIPNGKLILPNIIDVTQEYEHTANITYDYKEPIKNDVGFLMVFNRGKWKPLWWGKANSDGVANFTNMGRNLVYLPASHYQERVSSKSQELKLAQYPILLPARGEKKILIPDQKKVFDCKISRRNETILKNEDYNTVELINNEKFTLFYWDGGWKKQGDYTVENEEIKAKNVPVNGLFRLLPQNPDDFERIFTLNPENCKISWF